MTRIKKVSPNTEKNDDPQLTDELRRFIAHASDMIEAQHSVCIELEQARHAIDSAKTVYEKSAKSAARGSIWA